MPQFAWNGRDAGGAAQQGVLEAEHESAAAVALLAGGITPLEIRPRAELEAARVGRVSAEELLMFARQLGTLQRAGVPMLRALAGLQASAARPPLAALMADLRLQLEQGRDLATALSRHLRLFGPFFVALVRVGELTGRLSEALERLAGHLEYEIEARARVRQALRYPAFVLIAIVLALVVVNLFVLPTFATVFAGFKTELPLMTQLLLGVSAFTVQAWPLLLGGAVGGGWLLARWRATAAGRLAWDRALLRLPVVGPLLLKVALGRFARSFAMATQSGVPVSQAMGAVAQTVGNAFVAQRIERMRAGIERGESLTRCASAAGVFTPVVLQMLAVGEETGELDALLLEVARLYERETDHAVKGLSAAIEPVLLVLVGLLVLLLALGIFLPLWNLGQAVKGQA
jgi:MSHA biogenesis protein MshG